MELMLILTATAAVISCFGTFSFIFASILQTQWRTVGMRRSVCVHYWRS